MAPVPVAVDANNKSGETSKDDRSGGHGFENVGTAARQDNIVHWGGACSPRGLPWQARGDESSVLANLKDSMVKGQGGQVCSVDDVDGASSETSVKEGAVSVNFKVSAEVKVQRLRVHWTDEVDGPNDKASADEHMTRTDAVPMKVRGLLKQALGRSRARKWLFNEGLESQGPLTTHKICTIGSMFSKILKEEGADELRVRSETMRLYRLLNEEMLRRSKDDSAKAAAGDLGGVEGPPQKVKEPEPEGRHSLITATVTWLQWYFRIA